MSKGRVQVDGGSGCRGRGQLGAERVEKVSEEGDEKSPCRARSYSSVCHSHPPQKREEQSFRAREKRGAIDQEKGQLGRRSQNKGKKRTFIPLSAKTAALASWRAR